jgi:hypothetical protein
MRVPVLAPSLLLVVLLAGCAELLPSQDTAGLPEYGATATPVPPPSSKAVEATRVDAAAAEADELVRSVSPRAADVRSGGRRLEPDDDGDAVDAGHATLSGICGRELRSDAHRVARHRVQVVADGNAAPEAMTVEVVAYRSDTWARRALAEWRDAIGGCELDREVDVLGVPVRIYSASERRNAELPCADNAVTTWVTGVESTGVKQTAYQVMQRHGTVLSIVAVAGEQKPTAATKAEALRLAKLVGDRQAKLRA